MNLDYVAKKYAELIVSAAIEDAAQDRVGESVGIMAQDDGLELSLDQMDDLNDKVYTIINSHIVIKIN